MLRGFVVAGFLVAATSVVGASPASALAADWTSVSAGSFHTCAIRSVGKLYCWGSDVNGRVGNGATTGDVNVPAQITSATDWKSVAAGGSHTCAIRSVGKLYCWGSDGNGQVGDGATTGDAAAPKLITSATDWKTVDAGFSHTCAIRSVGKLYCWGSDGNGQVGNGATTGDVTVPKLITSATDWKSVSTGDDHTCAVRSVGKLYCWGFDDYGQVGNGATTGDVTAPTQITSATDWTSVSAGDDHTCAVRGKLYCWGYDGNGQVGNGATTGNVTVPAQITSATDWKSVAAASSHTCAVRGKLYCWGDDANGQVGNGVTTGSVTSPAQITSATDWKSVGAGFAHTCAVRGKLYCWGWDGYGQVGNGAIPGSATSPQQV